MVIIDDKGLLRPVNTSFENNTTITLADVIGTSFTNLMLTPESKTTLIESLQRRTKGVPVEPYEEKVTHIVTREVGYCEINGKKILYDGQLADLVIFRDITHRKKRK